MKPYILLLPILSFPLCAIDTSLLSSEKKAYYEQQENQINAGYEKLRYDWISPLTLKGSNTYEKSAALGLHDTRQNLSAGIAQDIFRSGGITYSIDYANAKKKADTIGMEKEISLLNQQLVSSVLNYRKNTLLLQQSDLKLKNAYIEVFLKQKQYEAGDIDITLLNNALMNRSIELKNNASIQFALSQQKFEAAKFSDHFIDSINLPILTLNKKETFLKEGWDIRYAQAQSQSNELQYKQIKSSYLPKLTLIGDMGLQRYTSYDLSNSNYQGNYYDMGLQLSIPLTYNSSAAIQEAQSAYLKQQSQIADSKRQMDALYEQSLSHIASYQHIIDITKDNLKFYEGLINATQSAVKAGFKAGYDLQTLQNTNAIEALEININEINIQIELSTLHYLMHPSQENSL
ncbi:MAG: TolC family protein [Sulfuricurvum sp.]|nr:TolC family protein [Sulfuricurvum sp.]